MYHDWWVKIPHILRLVAHVMINGRSLSDCHGIAVIHVAIIDQFIRTSGVVIFGCRWGAILTH